MKAPQLGLKSEALRAALQKALAGRDDDLLRLLAHHGGLPAPRPNFDLAAAFGVEVAAHPGDVTRLLARLAADDAAPDTAQAYLPVAAVYGYVYLTLARNLVQYAFGLPPLPSGLPGIVAIPGGTPARVRQRRAVAIGELRGAGLRLDDTHTS